MSLAKEEAPANWTGALSNETAAQPLHTPILASGAQPSTLEAAQELTATGVSVIPIKADGSKATLGKWTQAQERRADPAQVAQWFSTPGPGLGAVMGAVSGNLLMVEIEGRAADRRADLEQLAEASGLGELWRRVCAGWMESSPSGGIHWFIRTPTPFPSRKLAQTADKVCLAETKGEGGYSIMAPSSGGVHATGKPWVRLAGGPATACTVTQEELEQFLTLFSALDERPAAPTPERTPRPAANTGQGIPPGEDYENRTPWADILTPHGWAFLFAQQNTTYWRRPGKSAGISATTGHADDRDRMWVFTSSTEFQPETPYTKFAAYALLNHGGDYAAAASQLRREGYGGALPDHRTDADGLQGLLAEWTPQRAQELADIEQTVTGADPTEGADAAETLEQLSWDPIDLTSTLNGTAPQLNPTLMERTDGAFLLYPGMVHSFNGEPESGKSMIALGEIARLLVAGEPALLVDFESDQGTICERLLAMGATPRQILDHLHYLRPQVAPSHLTMEGAAWERRLGTRYALVVLDGVTEAFSVYGVGSLDNDEVTAWIRRVPKRLAARTGAAVVLVDHVVKNADNQGRFAIGAQAKLAGLTGASYMVEVLEPIGKGMAGKLALRVGKDRPGMVRPMSGAYRKGDRSQEAAVAVIDSTTPGTIRYRLEPPRSAVDVDYVPHDLMERVSRFVEGESSPPGFNRITSEVAGKKEKVREARDLLVAGGYVRIAHGGNNTQFHVSVKPYRRDSLGGLLCGE